MLRAALVTAELLPIPAADAPLLTAALEEAGFATDTPAWSDSSINWAEYDLVLVGSAWDYHTRVDEFLAWAEKVNNATMVLNVPKIIGWNARKTYLNQLAGAGIHVIPTLKVGPSSHYTLDRLNKYLDSEELVIKPVVGAGASGLVKLHAGQEDEYQALKALGDYLVQPYLPSILEGESSLTMIDGQLSHSVKKSAKEGDFRVQEEHGGSIQPYQPTEAEIELAGVAMWVLPTMPLYARVDMVEFKGRPALMELELIEPDLHLRFHPESASTLAKAARARHDRKEA